LVLFVADLLNDLSGLTLIIPSVIIAALAAVCLRAQGIGKQHIGLAWAIAATCGLCLGVYILTHPEWDSHLIIGLTWCLPVLVVMAVLMPNRAYRFMAVTAFVFILLLSGGYLASAYLNHIMAMAVMLVLVAGVVVVWIGVIARQDSVQSAVHREITACLRLGIPTGLALLCLASVHSSFVDELFWHFSTTAYSPTALGRGIAVGLLLGALIQALAFRGAFTAVYLPAALLCGVIALFAPGIGFGLALLLAARYQGSKEELILSGVFLMLYLIYWYYFLSITLLHKSLLLLATGVILLGLAMAAKRCLPADTEAHYAR